MIGHRATLVVAVFKHVIPVSSINLSTISMKANAIEVCNKLKLLEAHNILQRKKERKKRSASWWLCLVLMRWQGFKMKMA